VNSDFILFRDLISGLEYIRPLSEFSSHGLRVDLGAYDYRVYMDFSVITDEDGSYSRLYDYLHDIGVHTLQDALLDLKFVPLSENIDLFCSTLATFSSAKNLNFSNLNRLLSSPLNDLTSNLSGLTVKQKNLPDNYQKSVLTKIQNLEENFQTIFPCDFVSLKLSLVIWSLLYEIFSQSLIPNIENLSRPLANQPYFSDSLTGGNRVDINTNLQIIGLLAPALKDSDLAIESIINIWFESSISNTTLGLSDYDGITWFNKESFEILLDLTVSYLLITESPVLFVNQKDDFSAQLTLFRNEVLDRMKMSNYQVEIFHKTLLQFVKEWTSLTVKSRS